MHNIVLAMVLNDSENGLNSLPVEIWILIVNYLKWDSWTTLHSLHLSCRELHRIVSPVLFRAVRICFPPADRINACRFGLGASRVPEGPASSRSIPMILMKPPREWRFKAPKAKTAKSRKVHPLIEPDIGRAVYHHIRELVVSCGYDYEEEKYRESIPRLVDNLPNLETLRWRGIPFPPQLFQSLKARESPPQLYYEGGPQALTSEPLLLGASFIKSLSITLPSTPLDKPVLDGLQKLILSLPNLHRLLLKQSADPMWRINGSPPLPLFSPDPDSRVPATLRVLTFANLTLNSEQAGAWARCFQKLNLRHLDVSGLVGQVSGLIEALTGCVPGLNSFAISIIEKFDNNGGHAQILATLDEFFQQIRMLECLSVNYLPKKALLSAMRHHGRHLRQLRVQNTGPGEMYPGPTGARMCFFSPEEIVQLSIALPAVQRLGLDLGLKSEIPYEYLSALATFPSLTHLELDTPSYRVADPSWSPWLDKSVVKGIFKYIAARAQRYLTGLDIKVHVWEPVLRTRKADPMRYAWIFAAWREAVAPRLIHVRCLTCNLEAYRILTEDSLYEQTMRRVGSITP
ncbi:hypothetical protein BJX66DRAFT_315085 [Aspergillus keveii]|uniref:F-box domain-containing protein n=1 Tax=Aspergillus keveii TaxID=714993 RepID=A0ABR4FPY3_9EURO